MHWGAVPNSHIKVIWPQMLALVLIGAILFSLSLSRFRKTIGQMA